MNSKMICAILGVVVSSSAFASSGGMSLECFRDAAMNSWPVSDIQKKCGGISDSEYICTLSQFDSPKALIDNCKQMNKGQALCVGKMSRGNAQTEANAIQNCSDLTVDQGLCVASLSEQIAENTLTVAAARNTCITNF